MNSGINSELLSELRIFDDRIVDVNYTFLDMTGYSREELINKNLFETKTLLKSDFLFKCRPGESMEEYIFTKDSYPRKVKITRKDDKDCIGKKFEFEKTSDFIVEDKFPVIEQLIKSNIYGVVIFNMPDFRILRTNRKFISLTIGEKEFKDNFIGYNIRDIVKDWEKIDIHQICNNVMLSKEQYYEKEWKFTRFDGKDFYCSLSIIPVIENNEVKYMVITLKNNTEEVIKRKCLEQAINLNNSRNENICGLLDVMDLPIVNVTYPELRIKSCNEKLSKCEYVQHLCEGFSAENIIGKTVNEVLPNFITEKVWEQLRSMEKSKKSVYMNNFKITIYDNECYFNLIYQPLFNIDNEIDEILIIALDVTAEVNSKIKLEKILNTQEEFFSYIAHEFKAPLTVTYSALQLLDFFSNDELSDRSKRFINKIRQSTLQQLRLVNNLLDITKVDAGYLRLNKDNYDIVLMTQAIVNSVHLIGRDKGVEVIFKSDMPSRVILMDDEKYERILLNVLSNAMKFTPSGKKITVDLFLKDNFVNVRVADEGIGIPLEKQSVIFDRFGQVNNGLIRNGEGTGIGLCLAKMLTKVMGGDISLKSQVGFGSEFTITLPDITSTKHNTVKQIHEQLEDRLIQSVNVEFSNIYQ